MASIILKEERNLGELIFSEIKRHRATGTRTTPMPFPQLISLFLKKNKIWYLEPNEPIERLIPVGRNQVGKLGIELPLKKPMESTPKKKKPETPGSKLDDTQSSAPPGTPSTPSFIGSTVKNYMKEVLDGFHVDIANTNAELMTHMNTQMSKLVEYMVKHNESMLAQQQAQTSAIQEIGNLLRSLHQKVDTFIHSTAGPSTSEHIPASVPPPETTPGNILFSMDDPSSSAQIHVTLDDPTQPETTQPEPIQPQPLQPEPQQPPTTPVASPTGTEPLSDLPSPHSPSHQSPTDTDTIMVSTHHDDLQIPPLHLPDPQPSPTFSTHEDSQDTGSTPLEVSPVSAAQPSRSSSLSHD